MGESALVPLVACEGNSLIHADREESQAAQQRYLQSPFLWGPHLVNSYTMQLLFITFTAPSLLEWVRPPRRRIGQ